MKSMNNPSGIQVMNNQLKKKFLAAAIATAGMIPVLAYAQPDGGHAGHTSDSSKATNTPATASGMNHGSMNMSSMNHGGGEAPAQGHDAMKAPMKRPVMSKESSAMQGMTHGQPSSNAPVSAHNMDAMDHGDMQMQGGSAPPGARDPDAYSDGYVRNAGKYALPPSEKLVMSDMHNFGSVNFDRLEYVRARGEEWAAYEGEAWYGSIYTRAVIKAEGEVASGKLQESRTQLLWRHAVSTFWDTELGVRFDHDRGAPNREWLAFGFKGLAPYWFEVDATAYVGPSGRSALGLKAEYDILLTQKLYLQPSVEVNFYGKNDERRGIGSGLADGTAGSRLKYEITRQFVPYVVSTRSTRLDGRDQAAGAHRWGSNSAIRWFFCDGRRVSTSFR
ncbi:MAG: copper resistance protein B [Castellaniella sp.]|uniref:copper resistance protein B n=1 Tax=Castellaniella sp. TaxID=1955812 RepID=UPI003A8946EC